MKLAACYHKIYKSEKIAVNKAAQVCFQNANKITAVCGKKKNKAAKNCQNRWYKASLDCAQAANLLLPLQKAVKKQKVEVGKAKTHTKARKHLIRKAAKKILKQDNFNNDLDKVVRKDLSKKRTQAKKLHKKVHLKHALNKIKELEDKHQTMKKIDQ